jgi:hypothetical protein
MARLKGARERAVFDTTLIDHESTRLSWVVSLCSQCSLLQFAFDRRERNELRSRFVEIERSSGKRLFVCDGKEQRRAPSDRTCFAAVG